MMTPREFAAKYTSMDVYIIPSDAPKDDPRMDPDNAELPPGKWETTNVSRYRLGLNNGYKDDFWRVVASKFYKGGAIQVVVKNIDGTIETRVYRSDKEIALAATSAFWGKGTPEEVQITLQLRYRFQKTTFKLADFVKAYFIGLDCNGFVGNYIWRVWNNNDWYRTSEVPLGPNVQITTLMQKAGTPVTKLEDLVADRNGIYIMALTIGNGTILEKV
ncbi:MAG TPA: hypothetical protein VE621_24745, partial [Bryobacteraceae bacterium]|nr:hypothetical protein [Bryobacteraceae bacterium]